MHINNGYRMICVPEHPRAHKGYIAEHVIMAEQILKRSLLPDEVVHHYGEKTDNTKIIVCPNRAFYHKIHQRLRAFAACGHYDWRKCHICKKYDKPENLYINGTLVRHPVCSSTRHAEYYENNKAKLLVYRQRNKALKVIYDKEYRKKKKEVISGR